MAESNLRLSCKILKTLPAGSTIVADTMPLNSFSQLEFIVNLRDASGPRTKSLKLSAHVVDVSVRDQVYARYGDPINIEVNAVSTGTDFELQFVNNELVPVDLTLIKTIL